MKKYFQLPRGILFLIFAEFCIQMVNATLMYLLPVFMARNNYNNEEISHQIVFRFAGVFLLALPLGWIKLDSWRIHFFKISSFFVPLLGLGVVWAIDTKHKEWTSLFLFLWGASYTFMQVPIIPFLIRNVSPSHTTHAISLSYSTWSLGSIFSGLIIYILSRINPWFFSEKNLMILLFIFSWLGHISLWIHPFRPKNLPLHPAPEQNNKLNKKDLSILADALFPTLIIAIGAGFTIPLISLFFYRIHALPATDFSLYSFWAALLVALGSLSVPWIKNTFSYKFAVPLTQSLAVVFLIALAFTEPFKSFSLALPLALVAFLLRQPLMNMAGPMTTEVVMEYVGEKRRSMASALTSGIWSGSYVVSGFMAGHMFYIGYSFFQIFLVTAILYIFGIAMYYRLIIKHEKNTPK